MNQRIEAIALGSPIPQDAASKTILVVEDNELNMKLFCDLLKARGYNVLQAQEAATGLQIARERRPDLIIMDIQLPGEISGLEASGSLKRDETLKAIPIIAVTAFAMKGDEEKILGAGCNAYLSKPISVSCFLKTIEQFWT
jgi:two-component system cell cycle response regulator DivK